MRDRSHDDAMVELYRDDPDYALEYLNHVIENGDEAQLKLVLRRMTRAFGGANSIANKAHLDPRQISRGLSPKGHPTAFSFIAMLKAMGFHFSIHAGSENSLKTV